MSTLLAEPREVLSTATTPAQRLRSTGLRNLERVLHNLSPAGDPRHGSTSLFLSGINGQEPQHSVRPGHLR